MQARCIVVSRSSLTPFRHCPKVVVTEAGRARARLVGNTSRGGLMLRALWARATFLMLAFQVPAIVHAQTVADALDQPGLVVAGSGAAAWFGQSAVTRDGVDAVESGLVGDGQVSAVQTEYTYVNSGRVRFWWRVSSEQQRDAAIFLIDGVEVARISGEVGWDQPVFQVRPGLSWNTG